MNEYQDNRLPLGTEIRLCLFLMLSLGAMVGLVEVFRTEAPLVHVNPVESRRAALEKEIAYGDRTKKQVIFTFDGGSGIQSADAILAVLARHGVKGTFFLTGKFVEDYPDLVRKIVAGGHEIFNHTYDHPHLSDLTSLQIASELDRMEQSLRRVAGVTSAPYFRAPFGDRDARVLAAAYRSGYRSVYWSADARDWQESEGVTANEVRNTVLSNVYPGAIYLMHLGDNLTGEVLDDLFSKIEMKGYKIVSLSQEI